MSNRLSPLLFVVLASAIGCDTASRDYTDVERAVPGPVFLLGFDGLDRRSA